MFMCYGKPDAGFRVKFESGWALSIILTTHNSRGMQYESPTAEIAVWYQGESHDLEELVNRQNVLSDVSVEDAWAVGNILMGARMLRRDVVAETIRNFLRMKGYEYKPVDEFTFRL